MAIISWPQWPGFVKGLELSLLDLLTIAIYLSLPRSQNRLPFRIAMGFYVLAILPSLVQTQQVVPGLFYLWQLARISLVYAVVTTAADQRVTLNLLKGMAIGLCLARPRPLRG
jgi:hypothetical protein